MPPLWFIADEPGEADPIEEEPLIPGCMAGEPDVVDPEPVAVGRSVGAEGAGEFCAKAGAAAKTVTARQTAICFFSIGYSPDCPLNRDMRLNAHKQNAATMPGVPKTQDFKNIIR